MQSPQGWLRARNYSGLDAWVDYLQPERDFPAMDLLGGALERSAILLNMAAQRLFNAAGRIATRRTRAAADYRGDLIEPQMVDGDAPIFDPRAQPYTDLRVNLLTDFIDKNALDVTVIVGCSYGRELQPLARRLSNTHPDHRIIGADMSERAIAACRTYNLRNADFVVLDVESAPAVQAFLSNLPQGKRVGVYLCETAPYVLPDRLQAFVSALRAHDVAAVQFLEATLIDWDSRAAGMHFTLRQDYWRHNYVAILRDAGYTIDQTKFFDGSIRLGPPNQPLWLVSGSR